MKPLVLAATILFSVAASAADRLIVHEWGTFTCLQNERGVAIRGINTDDEPVPAFVHRLSDGGNRLGVINASFPITPALGKGAKECHPDVKLRLETPVVYFYFPDNYSGPRTLDVHVAFQGGWLTEFYPNADWVAPGSYPTHLSVGWISPDTVGELTWRGLKLGTPGAGPATSDHVWTAPRATNALNVAIPNGETEKFLFYRGVGNIDAPLTLRYTFGAGALDVYPGSDPNGVGLDATTLSKLWLVDIADNDTVAFAEFGPVSPTAIDAAHLPLDIQNAPHTLPNLASLRRSMHTALVHDGLYADEADAMLNTWELSYFKSAGTRLFFLVPRSWTDAAIPIQFSVPVNLTRVMMGRVELINPQQRTLLRSIANTKVANYTEFINKTRKLLLGQQKVPDTVMAALPAPYGDFLRLGRFRSALVLAEQKAKTTTPLSEFVTNLEISYAR